MLLDQLVDLVVRHVGAGPRRRSCPSHFPTLGLLTWLLSPVRLSLRSCWHDVSAKSLNARRHRRLALGLTLSWGLLEERAFPRRRPRLWLARVVDLPQRVPLRRRHVILALRRRGVLRMGLAGLGLLDLLPLLRVVDGIRLVLRLDGRWWGKLCLRRRRTELLQVLTVNRLTTLDDVRDAVRRLRGV